MQPNSFSHGLIVVSLSLLGLWQIGSCEGGKKVTMPQQQNRVAAGVWGGQNVHIEVSDGGVQIRFNCAHGRIEGPVTLDADGRFSAKGDFVRESMGPTYEDDPATRSRPAVYSGEVRDKEMTLTVTITGDKDDVGTYSLTQGKNGSVRRCH